MILNINEINDHYIVVWIDTDKCADLREYARNNSFLKVARQDLEGNYLLLRSLDDDYKDHINEYDFFLEVDETNASKHENLPKLVRGQEQSYWKFIFLVNDQETTDVFPGLQMEICASDDNIINCLEVGVSML